MSLWRIVLRELIYRKSASFIALGAVAVAVSVTVAILSLLRSHEARAQHVARQREQTQQERMQTLKDDIYASMDGLGLNVSLLPQGQEMANWLSADFGAKRMPEDYVEALKRADPETFAQPTARLRRTLLWPEKQWSVIVAGTEGLIAGQKEEGDRVRLQPIPSGAVWAGHEIWRGLELEEGQTVRIDGHEFRVGRRLPEEGSRDDITLWMPLADAQTLLDEPGHINEIVATGTRAAWEAEAAVQDEVDRLLPGVQAVVNVPRMTSSLRARLGAERESLAMIRMEQETQGQLMRTRKRLALLLNGLMAVVCGGWIGLLAYGNALDRNVETGLWAALGMPRRRIVFLYSVKWAGLCLTGALLGLALGQTVFVQLRAMPAGADGPVFYADIFAGVLLAALALAALAGGVPAHLVSKKDPSIMLREEGS